MSDANNKTGVPRCKVCGAFMEKAREGRRATVYECCGLTRTRPNPGFQSDPDLYRREYE